MKYDIIFLLMWKKLKTIEDGNFNFQWRKQKNADFVIIVMKTLENN